MGIFNLFSRSSSSNTLQRFLYLVYEYGPNVLDYDVFSSYRNILATHSLSEISNLTRVAVLDASLHHTLPFYFENFLDAFNSVSNNPFILMQDRFLSYWNSIHDFETASYPNRQLLSYSKSMNAPYEDVYVMLVDSAWLFTRIVSNFRRFSKDTFLTSVSRNILRFCNSFPELLRSE